MFNQFSGNLAKESTINRLFFYLFLLIPIWAITALTNNLASHVDMYAQDSITYKIFMRTYFPIILGLIPGILFELKVQSIRKRFGLKPFRSYKKLAEKYAIDFNYLHPISNLIKLGNESSLNPHRGPNEVSLAHQYSDKLEKELELYHEMEANHITYHKYQKEIDALFADVVIK